MGAASAQEGFDDAVVWGAGTRVDLPVLGRGPPLAVLASGPCADFVAADMR